MTTSYRATSGPLTPSVEAMTVVLVLIVFVVGGFVYNTLMKNISGPDTTPRDWLPVTPAGRIAIFSVLIGIVIGMMIGSYLLASPFALVACGLAYMTITQARERNPLLILPLIDGALLIVLPIAHSLAG